MGNQLLCSRHELPALIAKAETMKAEILADLKAFYAGDIDVRIYQKDHTMGFSVAADLTVNGELCKTYDPADLCFIDLNALVLQRLAQAMNAQCEEA